MCHIITTICTLPSIFFFFLIHLFVCAFMSDWNQLRERSACVTNMMLFLFIFFTGVELVIFCEKLKKEDEKYTQLNYHFMEILKMYLHGEDDGDPTKSILRRYVSRPFTNMELCSFLFVVITLILNLGGWIYKRVRIFVTRDDNNNDGDGTDDSVDDVRIEHMMRTGPLQRNISCAHMRPLFYERHKIINRPQ